MSAYTDDQVTSMVEAYGEGNTEAERTTIVARLAEDMGKTTRSIISKLSSLGVYIPKAKKKASATTMRKGEYVNAIRIMLGARDDQLKSMDKMTKVDLEVVMEMLKGINNRQEVA